MPSDSPQLCSTPDCSAPAAYRTRSKPTWCTACIEGILLAGGMRAVEPVRKATAFTLMECTTCGTQTHNRLSYVLDKNAVNEPTCRACYWTKWGASSRSMSGLTRAVSVETARAHAEEHGYDYLGPLTHPSLGGDPHHVRCRVCRKLSAERLGDIGWGCACSRNGKSASKTTVRTTKARTPTVLFKDSGARVVTWWDHNRNSQVDFDTAPKGATRTVAWVCPDCSYQFTAPIREMVEWRGCPQCERARKVAWQIEYAALKSTMVADHPLLAAAWDDPADPATVPIAGGWESRRFLCPNGHHPRISPHTYLESGCPHCRAADTRKMNGTASLLAECPEIASQWDYTKNGKLTPDSVTHSSKRVMWWRDDACGHEWQEAIRDRNKYQRYRCPKCRTILDSLAYQYPLLAQEWSPRNPVTAWYVRPYGKTLYDPEWVCANNGAHVWTATLSSRTNGSDCPECRQAGKSKIELDHLAAAKKTFGRARSGVILRSAHFTRRPAWTADITVALAEEQTLVIEYDGSYWHRDKQDVDRAKSLDLIAGGYRVVRLREHPLPSLDIDAPTYAEIVVHATAPAPAIVMARIKGLVGADV